jgi:hypothetical protein
VFLEENDEYDAVQIGMAELYSYMVKFPKTTAVMESRRADAGVSHYEVTLKVQAKGDNDEEAEEAALNVIHKIVETGVARILVCEHTWGLVGEGDTCALGHKHKKAE